MRCWKALQDEDPDLLILCPPCGPFSLLQNLNYTKMDLERGMVILGEGVSHLEFAMKIFEWQVRRGKVALFEHPSTSRAWSEESVERVLRIPGVWRVRADQCQQGLHIQGAEHPSRKPTDFMVNSRRMAERLSKRCQGGHQHQPLINGRAKQAERYPEKLCDEILKGFKEEMQEGRSTYFAVEDLQSWVFAEEGEAEEAEEDDLEDALDQEVEEAAHDPRVQQRGRGVPDEEQEDEGGLETRGHDRGVSASDKALVKKLHANLGHPKKQLFVRVLRMGRARAEVVKYVKEEFRCPICEAHPKPKAARPAIIPRHFEPGKVIGVDVVYMPSEIPRKNVPVLNVVNWATCYQTLEPLEEGTSSERVWKAFMRSWVRVFGVPEIVVVDQGREFMGDFSVKVNESGAMVRTIGARSPWQQGRTERHGGLAKGVLQKVVDQVGPTSRDEWISCIYEVESVKNRMFNRSGFSPTQRQIGMNVRIPGSLCSDDAYEATLLRSTATQGMQRMFEIREAAMEGFLKHSSQEVIRKAQKARPRVAREFFIGEKVFVYRKPLPRRGDLPEAEGRKAVWCGPGSVLMTEGPNVWVAMRGEMWKCSKEQLRSATPEEEEAYGLLNEEFKELKAELTRKGSKRAFKDISSWSIPPVREDDEESDEEPPAQRLRRSDEEGEEPEPSQMDGEEQSGGAAQESSSSSSSSSDSKEEPEGEKIEEALMPEAMRSVEHNERLDGVNPPGYEPMKRKLESLRFKPYTNTAMWCPTDPADEDEKDKKIQDGWRYLQESHTLVRMHHTSRRGKFKPSDQRGCPVPVKYLRSESISVQETEDGRIKEVRGNWRKNEEEPGPQRFWTGFTEFKLKSAKDEKRINWNLVANRGADEVKESDITPEEWPRWKIADDDEWTKVAASGAVVPLSEEESREVERQLRDAGTVDRILPSTMVRRWKPAEQPGQPPTMKSRWCIRGDRDPDILSLDRYAPTVTTAVISIALQTAASRGFRCAIGDLKNAFMQSEPLRRPEGRLFCRQPRGGLSTLAPCTSTLEEESQEGARRVGFHAVCNGPLHLSPLS